MWQRRHVSIFSLRHPGYRADDGFWIMHQTYAVADGHFLCNTIANHMQSNKNISLDDGMTISMKIFERDKKSMAGRGRNIPKESLGSKVMVRWIINIIYFMIKFKEKVWCQMGTHHWRGTLSSQGVGSWHRVEWLQKWKRPSRKRKVAPSLH